MPERCTDVTCLEHWPVREPAKPKDAPMSDPRDDLAALIAETYDAHGEGSWDSAVSAAEGILARWRLVPVEAQHRAADELTRHDQDAGIYEPQRGDLFRNTITGSVFRYVGGCEFNPVMLGDRPARGAQLTYAYTEAMAGPLRPYTNDDGCACGRTDRHGPHED